MSAGTRLAGYALVLAAALGAGAVVGAAAGPVDVADVADGADHDPAEGEVTMDGTLPAGGLLVSQGGFTLEPEDRVADAGPFAFTISGPDGEPVRSYDPVHERELHLIVASRDLGSYVHLHPARDRDGRWSVDLPALPAGAYRAFADFQPTGAPPYTLGVDVVVPGTPEVAAPLRPTDRDVVDGYDVTLDADLAGGGTEVAVTVSRGGQVITTEPYLGAAGHLVALRDGDLAYLHVHAVDEHAPGPVRFAVEVPSAGTYALFFDFQVGGVVRTARFVVEAPGSTAAVDHGGGH